MIVGDRVRLARRLRGLTAAELARDLDVSSARISQLERKGAATDEMVERLAAALSVPAAFLQRGDVAEVEEDQLAFRHRVRTTAGLKAGAAAHSSLFTEAVTQIRAVLAGLVDIAPPDIPNIPLETSTPAEVEQVAAAVRSDWGLGLGPIPDLVELLESRGVWVHVLPAPLRDIDAFSAWVAGEPHVFLLPDSRDAEGERLSTAHELGHLIMHVGMTTGDRATEGQAFRFGGAFLVPATTWMAEAPRSTNPEAYVGASQRWRVSVAALIRRSFDLRVLDEGEYRSAMIRLSMGGHRRDESHLRGSSPPERPGRLKAIVGAAARQGHSVADIFDDLSLPADVLAALLGSAVPEEPRPTRGGHLRVVK